MALFKSKQQRELEARIQIRQCIARINRFIQNARNVEKRYWELGKQALRIGDRQQFEQLAAALLRTRDHVHRWQRYLLQLETLNVRRDEVAATGEFLKGLSAMTNSILRGATPQQVAEMQAKLEQAVAKAEALDEMMAVAMETSAESVFGSPELEQTKMDELARQMAAEAETDESAELDHRISKGLKEIEEAMRKEL